MTTTPPKNGQIASGEAKKELEEEEEVVARICQTFESDFVDMSSVPWELLGFEGRYHWRLFAFGLSRRRDSVILFAWRWSRPRES